MTAEEAVRYLDVILIEEPEEVDPKIEDALEAIAIALTLAYAVLWDVEWETSSDGRDYCISCGRGRHLGHSPTCPRQLALAAIKKG
jgi:hypothetical protein